MTGIYRYVRHSEVEDFIRLGWLPTNALEGTSHGQWSVLCRWICPACVPVEPKREAA